MTQYRKKPVVVDAMQFDGENAHQVVEWMEGKKIDNPFSLGRSAWIKQKIIDEEKMLCVYSLVIKTLEGEMEANCNDWVIRGVKGEFYPCKPEIFAMTYEAVS